MTEQAGTPGPAQPQPPEQTDDQSGSLGAGEAVVPVGTVDLGLEPVIETVAVRRGAFGVTGSGDTSGFGGLVRASAMPGATANAPRRLRRRAPASSRDCARVPRVRCNASASSGRFSARASGRASSSAWS